MTLSWTGSQTSYDNAAIEQTSPGWGLSCNKMASRSRWDTAENQPVNAANAASCTGESSDASLSEGPFSAWATLQVDYNEPKTDISLRGCAGRGAADANVQAADNLHFYGNLLSKSCRWWYRARCWRKCISPRSAVESDGDRAICARTGGVSA